MSATLADRVREVDRPAGMAGTEAWYAYAVVPAGMVPPARAAILPEADIAMLECGAVAALVSRIPRALFDGAADLADPDWVAARATAHHGVVLAAAQLGPCLPMAFGALFSDPARLSAWLADHAGQLAEALAQVDGASEWTVALTEDRDLHCEWRQQHDPALAALAAQVGAAGEGLGYLLGRRLQRARQDSAAAGLGEIGARIDAILHRETRRVLAQKPPDPAGAVVRRWSALVSEAQQAACRAALEGLAAGLAGTGLGLTLNGPWPAYAFAREAMHDAA